MSFPDAKKLSKAFPSLSASDAQTLSDTLEAAVGDTDKIDDAMDAANKAIGGHGVEAIAGNDYQVDKYWMDTVLLYVNLGDTYDTTILYDTENEKFSVGSWGDFMEKWENEDEDGDEEEDYDGDPDEEDAESEDAETEEA